MNTLQKPRHQITSIRRESRRRLLTVINVQRLTPQMQRIVFHSPDLADFETTAPDDHIKLFFPASNADDRTRRDVVMRDYTPRRFDPKTATLTIDFALHQAGPATSWASRASPGDTIEIGGPRKSNVLADDFDWYLLVGDETALPAIGRRVEELRAGVRVITLVVVETIAERQTFTTSADWTPLWIPRAGLTEDDGTLLHLALADHEALPGDGYIWIAAEASVARSLRALVSEDWGHPREWTKSSGYWVRGEDGAHE